MHEFIIRKLNEDDLSKGFFDTLQSLSDVKNMNIKIAKKIFEKINIDENYHVFVAVNNDQIVGTLTLFIEQKLTNNCGKSSHIEDVSVHKSFQNKGVATELCKRAIEYSKKMKCFQTVLDCADEVIPLYQKNNFKIHGSAIRYNHL